MPSKHLNNKKVIWIILILGLLILFLFFQTYSNSPQPTSISSPTPSIPTQAVEQNLTGFYKGTLPCADCPGVDETLILAGNGDDPTSGTFILEDTYQEKPDGKFQTDGEWKIIENNIIEISQSESDIKKYFQILDNGNLEILDSNKEKINSSFNKVLKKS